MAVLFLVLKESPTKVYKGSCFAAFLLTFVVVCVLDDSHSNLGEMKS
jgi:hypothetical protein